jgi:hypothetical protein
MGRSVWGAGRLTRPAAAAVALLIASVMLACATRTPAPGWTVAPTQAVGSGLSTAVPATPTATPSGQAPSASASPTAAPGPAALAAFLGLFESQPPPFHVVMETELSGATDGTARLEGDVDGADYRAQLLVRLEGLPERDSQVVVVSGTGYLADAGSNRWRMVPDYETIPPLNPFLGLAEVSWSPIGPTGGRNGNHGLRSTDWTMPVGFLHQPQLEDVAFDVWVDDEGRPVEGALTFKLTGLSPQGQAVEHAYTARYEFSRVGEAVSIGVPPLPGP